MERIEAVTSTQGAVAEELEIHVILDNYPAHKAPLIRQGLAKRPHFRLHDILASVEDGTRAGTRT